MTETQRITVFLTGGAGGIALSILEVLSRDYNGIIGLCDIDGKTLSQRAQTFSRAGLTVMPSAHDIRDGRALKDAIEATAQAGGGLDLLINNAGIMTGKTDFETLDGAALDMSLDVNFRAVVQACHIAWPYLSASKGCVVNNASGAGKIPLPSDPVYSASKAAVIMFTRAQAARYKQTSIRFNAVCPGVVDTPIIRDETDGDYLAETKAFMSAFELIEPISIARAILAQYQAGLNDDIRSILNSPREQSNEL